MRKVHSMAPTIFGPGGTVSLGAYLSADRPDYMGAYLSGAAPIVGTATIPQAYLPFDYFIGCMKAIVHDGYDPYNSVDSLRPIYKRENIPFSVKRG